MDLHLTTQQKKDLLLLVKIIIAERLAIPFSTTLHDLDFSDELFKQKFGAFVTLHINGRLRGCIGYIKGVLPLVETIQEMALSAAFRDPRFPPLSAGEFDALDMEISILSPIEPVNNISEIKVGRDGLIISQGGASGLLLPQVATEQGWDVKTFLSHTCLKAGLSMTAWKEESTRIEKFSATVFNEHNLD